MHFSGVDYSHPALGGCVAIGPSCRVAYGKDFVDYDDDPRDTCNGAATLIKVPAADPRRLAARLAIPIERVAHSWYCTALSYGGKGSSSHARPHCCVATCCSNVLPTTVNLPMLWFAHDY